MAVLKKYLFSYPGSPVFTDSALAYSDILVLKREGTGYDEITGTPTGREFSYNYATGVFNFDTNIFTGDVPSGRYIPDKILVIYKQ